MDAPLTAEQVRGLTAAMLYAADAAEKAHKMVAGHTFPHYMTDRLVQVLTSLDGLRHDAAYALDADRAAEMMG